MTCQAHELTKPKEIRFKDGYEHKFVDTKFPRTLENGFYNTKSFKEHLDYLFQLQIQCGL